MRASRFDLPPPGSSAPASAPLFEWPRASKWHRTWRVLLVLSLIQMVTSIYIFFSSQRMFFGFYLAYAAVASVFMLMRFKWGLLWFAGGSVLYCVWLTVSCWRAVSSRQWVQVCLDFTLASFEFLILCVAVGRFHEIGGLRACCLEPEDPAKWKGALLVGGDSGRHGPDPRLIRATTERVSGAVKPVTLHLDDSFEAGRSNLLEHAYVPPHPSHDALNRSADGSSGGGDGNGVLRSSSQNAGLFSESGDTSQVSSASSSYNATVVGRGYLAFPDQARPQEMFGVPIQ